MRIAIRSAALDRSPMHTSRCFFGMPGIQPIPAGTCGANGGRRRSVTGRRIRQEHRLARASNGICTRMWRIYESYQSTDFLRCRDTGIAIRVRRHGDVGPRGQMGRVRWEHSNWSRRGSGLRYRCSQRCRRAVGGNRREGSCESRVWSVTFHDQRVGAGGHRLRRDPRQ